LKNDRENESITGLICDDAQADCLNDTQTLALGSVPAAAIETPPYKPPHNPANA
jgi:hypothetical protein